METYLLNDTYSVFASSPSPKYLLIQPSDRSEEEQILEEINYLTRHGAPPFALLVFKVEDWNRDLSPWEAPPVFGDEPFGCGAGGTLERILDLLPAFRGLFEAGGSLPVVIGGYSLAAFFSLWAAYQTDAFSAVAAASPSVWFPGWLTFQSSQKIHTRCVYLSLGDREDKTKNPVMSTVGDCIRGCYRMLQEDEGIRFCQLDWNPGNHFRDAGLRTAKGFLWALRQLKQLYKEQ